jgi:hypothetical protein
VRRVNILAATLTALLIGCSDLGLAPEPEVVAGEFSVESYTPACVLKINPETGQLQGYITVTLTYHFKGQPGTIDIFELERPDAEGLALAIDYVYPVPAGLTETLEHGFWTVPPLKLGDSVAVRCGASGHFWIRFGSGILDYGSFQWSEESFVIVTSEGETGIAE